MKKLAMSDKMLKVISVIVAIVIWFYIIVVLDPAIEVTIRDLPIQFVGEEHLREQGLGVVSESATTLTVKIKGSRKKMGRNDMKTIIAKVDLSNIEQTGTMPLPVEVVIPFEHTGISSQSDYMIDVKTEKLVEKTLNLEVKTTGSLAENFMAGPIKTDKEQVIVSGPESVIGKISGAGVVLDYADSDVDIDQNLPIKLYGTDKKEILPTDAILTRIHQNIKETMIHCSVVKLRTVKIQPVFDAAVGEDMEKLCVITPETVQIYGDDGLTAKVESIHTAPISVEKFFDTKKVKTKLVIPEGVKILKDIFEVEISMNEKATQTKTEE